MSLIILSYIDYVFIERVHTLVDHADDKFISRMINLCPYIINTSSMNDSTYDFLP